jgi:drug/metabolite transporter (DMT)-like permease
MPHPFHRRALFWLLVATLLWSLSFPLVQTLYIEQHTRLPNASTLFLATTLMAVRFGISALLLLPFIISKRPRITLCEWRQGLILAFYGGIGMWLQADALGYTKSSTCAFLTQGYCALLPLVHAVKQRRPPHPSILVSVLLVMVGVAWLSGVHLNDLRPGRGETETLLAAVIFTLQILCLENPRYRGNRSLSITWVMFFGIATFSLPCAVTLASHPGDIALAMWSLEAWLLTASLSVLCSIAAFGLMNHWQGWISSIQAGLIYGCEPVFTSIAAMFLPSTIGGMIGIRIPNETWTWSLLGGGLLITTANLIVHTRKQE